MSIANEIERLTTAKEDIKETIKTRGVDVADDTTLDSFADIVDSLPFVLEGTFTPEEDSSRFEIGELNFVPMILSLSCKELESAGVIDSILSAYSIKGFSGAVSVIKGPSDVSFAMIKSTSSVIAWSESGVAINVPQQSSNGRFKKGYTYKYIVAGGFSQ